MVLLNEFVGLEEIDQSKVRPMSLCHQSLHFPFCLDLRDRLVDIASRKGTFSLSLVVALFGSGFTAVSVLTVAVPTSLTAA